MLGIKDSLLKVPQREGGGRTAYDRFDYQTAWGISRLLELHNDGKNYAVGFEFHDDIVSLNDADTPTAAIFYQVKTKQDGNWSFAKITQRKTENGKKKNSFAGKMFDNFLRFGANVERLSFVSNQPMPDVIVVHGEQPFSKAQKDKLSKFVTNLTAEIGTFNDPEHTSLFFFMFSDLNLSNYEETVIGRIAVFLDQELGSHIPPKPFALLLNDYCRRRSKSLADVSSFEQLKATKFVTRADMSKWLLQAREQHERRPDWNSVANDLSLPFPQKHKLERAWREYEVLLHSRQNAATIAFTGRVQAIIQPAVEESASLLELVDAVYPTVWPLVNAWYAGASEHFVRAVILYEIKR